MPASNDPEPEPNRSPAPQPPMWEAGALAAALAAVVASVLWWSYSAPGLSGRATARYVGDAACRDCHPGQTAAHARSGHCADAPPRRGVAARRAARRRHRRRPRTARRHLDLPPPGRRADHRAPRGRRRRAVRPRIRLRLRAPRHHVRHADLARPAEPGAARTPTHPLRPPAPARRDPRPVAGGQGRGEHPRRPSPRPVQHAQVLRVPHDRHLRPRPRRARPVGADPERDLRALPRAGPRPRRRGARGGAGGTSCGCAWGPAAPRRPTS